MAKRRRSAEPQAAGCAADGEPSEPSAADLALIHGVTEDGEGLRIIRRRGETLEAGAVRPLREGRPIQGELVKLRPRPEFPLLCDVEVELPVRALSPPQASEGRPAQSRARETPGPLEGAPQHPPRSGRGPAQVASELYRRNWDVIWAPLEKKELN